MTTGIKVTSSNHSTCLNLEVSSLEWHNWLHDNFSLLSIASSDERALALFSFKTGEVLFQESMKEEQIKDILSRNVLALTNASDQQELENMVFKFEAFDTSGYFFSGIHFHSQGEYKRALNCYEEALKINSQLYRTMNLAGLCYRLTDQPEKAEEKYLAAIKARPESPEAFSNLGTLYAKQGKNKEAEENFLKALEIDNFYLSALLKLARIYLDAGDIKNLKLGETCLKLSQLFPEIAATTEIIAKGAGLADSSPESFVDDLKDSFPLWTDQNSIQLMKNIEHCSLNGALFYALRDIRELLNSEKNKESFSQIKDWCHKRFERIANYAKNLDHENLNSAVKKTEELFSGTNPKAKENDNKNENDEESQDSSFDPLGSLEFFTHTLYEIMRDGEITETEKKMVKKLKGLLRVTDDKYKELVAKIKSQVKSNPLLDKEEKGFNPERFYKNLVRSAIRDNVVDEGEKKILVFASKAFGLSSEKANKIIAEVKNEH
ncbi:MAG: tetratricopeptide repeat protein [Candidatus Rifleibacteriota bacterium]